MKKTSAFLFLAFLLTLPAWSQEKAATFMVFSDPHYYDPSLGTTGSAFENYLNDDRKLLRESDELIREAIALVSASDASFVLIPGDLTKDGTRVSHSRMAEYLKEMEETGRRVFVVPGNHDVLNGEAMSYRGDSAIRVANISPDDFSSIYKDFGYGEALERDPSSLSYLAEAAPGLWLLALDACRYRENAEHGHPITDGKFGPETLNWVKKILALAREQNKEVIVMMHHGVVEHYRGQEKNYGEYLVDDYPAIGRMLAENGVRVVFTGHYHAQDIAMNRFDKQNFLVDVETGSLVTYPCPVRTITMKENVMTVRSAFIGSIPSHPNDFQNFAREYVLNGIAGIAEKTLIGMHLRPQDAAKLSSQVALAFCTHYAGDEPGTDKPLDLHGVNLLGRFIISFRKSLVKGLYTDIEPTDNRLRINLNDGSWEL